jgi:hypothetical protein
MQENVGNVDRWLRMVVGGAALLGATRALWTRGAIAPGLLLAGGAILLETAVTRYCPVNAALGLDTRDWKPFGDLPATSSESASTESASTESAGTESAGTESAGSHELANAGAEASP